MDRLYQCSPSNRSIQFPKKQQTSSSTHSQMIASIFRAFLFPSNSSRIQTEYVILTFDSHKIGRRDYMKWQWQRQRQHTNLFAVTTSPTHNLCENKHSIENKHVYSIIYLFTKYCELGEKKKNIDLWLLIIDKTTERERHKRHVDRAASNELSQSYLIAFISSICLD